MDTATQPASVSSRHAPLSLAAFVVILASLMALNALATDIMLPAFPNIAAEYGVEVTAVQAVITAYMLGFSFSQLFVGFISDRYGRRSVLLAGLTVYTLAGMMTALAGSLDALLLWRFVQGLGAGAPRIICTAAIRDCYEGRRMARVMSLTMTIFMAAPVLAPSIGQGIMVFASWHWVMASVAFYGLVMLYISGRHFPETLPVENRIPLSWRRIREALRSVALNRQTVGYTLAAGTFFGALFGFIGQAQQLLVGVYGLGKWFPLVFAFMALSMSASSLVNSALVERFGMRVLSHTAVVAYLLLSLAMFALARMEMLDFWRFATIHVCIMLIVGLVFSNFNALALEPQGRFAGVASSFTGATTTALGAIIGFFIGRAFDGTAAPLAGGFALSGIFTIAIIAITEKGRLFRASSTRR